MRIYCDTNVIIRVVEGPDEATRPFISVVEDAAQVGLVLLTSELSLSELLVKPLKDRDEALAATYAALISGGGSGGFETFPVNRDVLVRAAEVRVRKPSLKLPDAIHVATAELTRCDWLASGDDRLKGAGQVPIFHNAPEHFRALIQMLS